jgi:hypothetical protein
MAQLNFYRKEEWIQKLVKDKKIQTGYVESTRHLMLSKFGLWNSINHPLTTS